MACEKLVEPIFHIRISSQKKVMDASDNNLVQITVEEAAALTLDQQPDVRRGPGRKLRRRSMSMAESEVLNAIRGDTATTYTRMYNDWIQSSRVDVAHLDDDLLAGKRLGIRTWFLYFTIMCFILIFIASCVVSGIMAAAGNSVWRWPAWIAGSLAAWAGDRVVFFALALSIEKIFATSQHVIYYMQGCRRPLERVIASCASLVVFCGLFQPFQLSGSSQVLKGLICLALATLGLLLAQVGAKILAAHFHRKGFFEKLQKALQDEYILMALSKPRGARMRRKSWTEQSYFQHTKARKNKDTAKLSDTRLTSEDPKLMKSLDAVERHVRKNRLKLVFDRCSEVTTESSAKKLAFYIFWNAREDNEREELLKEDLLHFLPDNEVDNAFSLLDSNGNGSLSLDEIGNAVIGIFERRQQLTASLQDTDSIIGTLHNILIVIVQVVFFFLYLLVWHVNVSRVWLTFSSIILAFTFVIGSSLRTAFENVMFLFIVHPYDVGDQLVIENESFVVHKLKLSTTVLERDNGIRVWFPNSRLNMMPIYNETRADVVKETHEIALDVSTRETVFEQVRRTTTEYIQANSKDFIGECSCVTTAALDPLKLRLTIGITYSFNHTQGDRLARVRHGFMMAVRDALVNSEARYSDPQIPGVTTKASLKKAAAVKSQKRREGAPDPADSADDE